MSVSFPALLFSLLAAQQASPPPPLVHVQPPNAGAVEATWDCRGREVRYRIETQWQDVRVVRFHGVAGEASAADLDRLNAPLADLWVISGLSFQCNVDVDQLLIEGPRKGGGGEVRVKGTWRGGELAVDVF